MEGDSQVAKKSIPRFTSFRPKKHTPNSNALVKDDDRPRRDGVTEAPISHQDTRKIHRESNDESKHNHRRHDASHHRHHRRKEKEVIEDVSYLESTAISAWKEGHEGFVVDKQGDAANLTYGALHRYTIPLYRRFGAGNVLGLPRRQRIDQYASNEKSVVLHDSHFGQWKRRDKAIFAKAFVNPLSEVRIRPESSAISGEHSEADFLLLGGRRLRKRKRGDHERDYESQSSSSTDEAVVDYRSIEGKAKPSDDPDDPDLQYTKGLSMLAEDRQSQGPEGDLRNIGIASLRKVEAEPTNTQAWIDLINHQDTIIGLNAQGQHSKVTNAEKLSNADIKLSMYEKALDKVKDIPSRERLLLGMMDEGSKIWETSKLANKWRSVLQTDPEHLTLWIRFLDFQQTHISTFRADDFRETSISCLKMLCKLKSPNSSAQLSNKFHITQAYILLRLTLCMRESGFSEYALAIWQAILEYNFCRPSYFDNSEKGFDHPSHTDKDLEALKSFEDFWESEVPRIGEEGSQGWAQFALNDGAPLDPRTDATIPPLIKVSMLQSWADSERAQSLQARQPARTIDDVAEDDPYRVILYSDIQPLLLHLDSSGMGEVLVHAFLAFCHLPPPLSTQDQVRSWWRDEFVRNAGLQTSEESLRRWNMVENSQGISSSCGSSSETTYTAFPGLNNALDFPTPHYLVSADSMFAKTWFSSFDEWKVENAHDRGPMEVEWIGRVLRILVDKDVGGDDLAEYFIAFECTQNPVSARKTAKTLLKKRVSSLRLYNAYALLEYRLGKVSAGSSVIATALNMSKTFNESLQEDLVLLWRTWIWEYLDSGDHEQATVRLLTLSETEKTISAELVPKPTMQTVSPAALLRTQRTLTDRRDRMISLGLYHHAALYAELLILLAYLCNSLSLESALSCFTSNSTLFTSRLPPQSPIPELFHQSCAKLLYHHVVHAHSFKPSLIRSTLSESIRLFPQNTIFLSLYAWNESRFRVDDRVRSVIQSIVLSSTTPGDRQPAESVTSHFFAIYIELHRGIALGSNTHTVRGTFERNVDSNCGKQSAVLWKLYFLFEYSRGEMHRAKGVFYRAISACPWAKELYLLAFEYLRDTLSLRDLRGVYEAMVEKGLRVHVSLEEMWESTDEAAANQRSAGR